MMGQQGKPVWTRRQWLQRVGAAGVACAAWRERPAAGADGPQQLHAGHPRLYFTAADLQRLRASPQSGQRARMWRNLQESARWALALPLRKQWIAPVAPDPNYENLYDRFYAIMGDLAVTEHLAFAYALSGQGTCGQRAREWVLASCRSWKREADGTPDGSKAYAVSRLL